MKKRIICCLGILLLFASSACKKEEGNLMQAGMASEAAEDFSEEKDDASSQGGAKKEAGKENAETEAMAGKPTETAEEKTAEAAAGGESNAAAESENKGHGDGAGEPENKGHGDGAGEPENKGQGNAAGTAAGDTPFAAHGKLSVNGTQLCDQNGTPYQLKGVSTHGIAWFPEYVNLDAFSTIRDWGGNAVRIAMYTEEYGGYLSGGDKEATEQLVDTGVQAAAELGMYVIIDWHILSDGNPNTHLEDAKVFFKEMAEAYADYENVIYEICNEPNGNVTWEEIKSYADEVIPVIREYAPEAVIIVGTPTWSQDVDLAAASPLDWENLMYACHFYAATHKQYLRDKVQTALDAGLPVIISEYSICDASGNGGADYEEAEKWAEFIDSRQLSYVQWNLANKNETSSLIRPDCGKLSGWEESELSDTGKWLKKRLGGA